MAHRDYSAYVRGSYVQVRLFADRLEVQSPGGLFGNVTVDNLEDEHSTRNARLMRMLEDLHVVENRGSGIGAMLEALRAANLEPPRFDDRRSSFRVVFHNHTLMSPDAIAWLNQFAPLPLNDRQRVALIYLRQHGELSNPEYRRLTRVDALTAGQELKGLVQQRLLTQHGAGRWTSYTLRSQAELPKSEDDTSDEGRILVYVVKHGSIGNQDCRSLLGVDGKRAWYLLNKLKEAGVLTPIGEGRWRRYTRA